MPLAEIGPFVPVCRQVCLGLLRLREKLHEFAIDFLSLVPRIPLVLEIPWAAAAYARAEARV